ncbi:hypothetical protein HYH03_005730 [Edaphochlamys debaryana]|uniref:Uncharacterized protein n=1 Tax=Edaphochlamys debaryana TaxID=47281 RepID=A0A835Y471_9CHLO|nr:hypothetical protein HYH03_005730 [Edaphochlamys debaryana]|eukprot:KAG2496127.1 hypothetical protein HYH03_005730 [Edaphochlamys debaryana]
MCKALGSILLLAVTLARFGLPVAYADTVRSIATAEELAAALLDNSVSVARIDARHIDLSDAAFLAWDNSTFPFLRTANITILGNTDLPEWPLLQLRAKKKLMLADHVHFTLRWLYIYRWRNDNFVRLPGWDTLAPSKPDVCYPLPIMGANYGAVERPASVPGVQTYTLGLPQTGCVNDSSVLKNRCWSDFSMINDVIFVGYDNDLAGKPVPNNYLLNISHTQQLCRSMLDAECLKVNQPIACMLVAMRGAILSAPVTSWLAPSPAANATSSAPTASPAALTGPSGAAPQTDTGGGGGGVGENTKAVIVGSVMGGVAFLAIVAGVAAWALHRRKRGPSQDAAAANSAAESKGTDRSQSGAAKCGKPWAQPGSEATGSGSGDSDGGGPHALAADHVSVRVAPAASCVYAAAAPSIMTIPTSVITGTTPLRADLQFCSPIQIYVQAPPPAAPPRARPPQSTARPPAVTGQRCTRDDAEYEATKRGAGPQSARSGQWGQYGAEGREARARREQAAGV